MNYFHLNDVVFVITLLSHEKILIPNIILYCKRIELESELNVGGWMLTYLSLH